MFRIILAAVVLAFSSNGFAEDNYEYKCDLAGTKSDIGEIVTVYLENGRPTTIQCRVPLSLDFKGDAKYAIAAREAQWVLFGPHPPVGNITSPDVK